MDAIKYSNWMWTNNHERVQPCSTAIWPPGDWQSFGNVLHYSSDLGSVAKFMYCVMLCDILCFGRRHSFFRWVLTFFNYYSFFSLVASTQCSTSTLFVVCLEQTVEIIEHKFLALCIKYYSMLLKKNCIFVHFQMLLQMCTSAYESSLFLWVIQAKGYKVKASQIERARFIHHEVGISIGRPFQ